MSLGLSGNLTKTGIVSPGIVTSNLVLKHNYSAGGVVPISDGACSFGGAATEDRVSITETAFNVDGAAYTFAFWAKRNVLGVLHTVLGKSSTASTSMLRFNTSNELKIESDTEADTLTVTQNVIDTNWHHYAITITGTGATIVAYQDGTLCADSGNVGDDNLTVDLIGAQNSGGADNEFDGYLCNIGIWEAVLTQAQVKSIMNKNYAGLSSSETTSLQSWWNLSSDANDSHGSNNGTLS